MNKKLLFCIISVLIVSVQAMGQKTMGRDSTFWPRLVVGSSLTYRWGGASDYHYRDYTWAANAALSPIKHLYVGVNYLKIWNKSDISPPRQFQLLGAFTQYHIGNNRTLYIMPELGFYRGDFCPCGPLIAHRRAGINYIAAGGGFGVFLYKNLELDLSFLFYEPLLPRFGRDYAYHYFQYVIGLNYDFRLPRPGKRHKKEAPAPTKMAMLAPQ